MTKPPEPKCHTRTKRPVRREPGLILVDVHHDVAVPDIHDIDTLEPGFIEAHKDCRETAVRRNVLVSHPRCAARDTFTRHHAKPGNDPIAENHAALRTKIWREWHNEFMRVGPDGLPRAVHENRTIAFIDQQWIALV